MKVLGRKNLKPSKPDRTKFLIDMGNAAWGGESKQIRKEEDCLPKAETKDQRIYGF